MTNEEAHTFLEVKQREMTRNRNLYNETAISINGLAILALEKQIPKKPINKTKCDNTTAKIFENCNIVVCPLCNSRLKLKSKGKHCDKCGQALDWSDSK